MKVPFPARRAVAIVALVLLVGGPWLPAARAAESHVSSQSVAGALLAIACGASARVCVLSPAPIVYVVTAAVCLYAMLDAWNSPDTTPK